MKGLNNEKASNSMGTDCVRSEWSGFTPATRRADSRGTTGWNLEMCE